MQKLDPVYVDLSQSSAAILRLRRAIEQGGLRAASPQVKVGLELEDGSTYPLAGTLQFADVTVDQSTGAVTVRAVFPNPQAELLPGMYVRAIVTEATEDHAVLVPQQSVTRNASGQAVAYVVGHDDKLEPRTLTLGRAMGDQWLVVRGIVPGDHLVIDGAQKAAPGALVVAIPETAPPSTAAARVRVAQSAADGAALDDRLAR